MMRGKNKMVREDENQDLTTENLFGIVVYKKYHSYCLFKSQNNT